MELVLVTFVPTQRIKNMSAGAAQQEQSECIGGLPVTAEDETLHHRSVQVTTGE